MQEENNRDQSYVTVSRAATGGQAIIPSWPQMVRSTLDAGPSGYNLQAAHGLKSLNNHPTMATGGQKYSALAATSHNVTKAAIALWYNTTTTWAKLYLLAVHTT